MPAPLFISHGAPDVLIKNTPAHQAMKALRHHAEPLAYMIISAHWQSGNLKITASDYPATIHDFHGFGAQMDAYHYPVPGAPRLACDIQAQLKRHGLMAELDMKRGLDHGAWIPMALIRPEADIPVIQISLPRQDDQASLTLGDALADLRHQNIQIIGSGALTHSLSDSLPMPETAAPASFAAAFRSSLAPAIEAADTERIMQWRTLPHAQRNHPTPEHLRPLLVAHAASGRQPGKLIHTSWSRAALAMDIWAFE